MRIDEIITTKKVYEGLSKVLFHFTYFESVGKILDDGIRGKGTMAVSFTRSIAGSYHIENRTIGVIFKLDGARLSNIVSGSPVGSETFAHDVIDLGGFMNNKDATFADLADLESEYDDFYGYSGEMDAFKHLCKISGLPDVREDKTGKYVRKDTVDTWNPNERVLTNAAKAAVKTLLIYNDKKNGQAEDRIRMKNENEKIDIKPYIIEAVVFVPKEFISADGEDEFEVEYADSLKYYKQAVASLKKHNINIRYVSSIKELYNRTSNEVGVFKNIQAVLVGK